jgi:putative membrane protein
MMRLSSRSSEALGNRATRPSTSMPSLAGARSRSVLMVRAKADVASPNGALSSQQRGTDSTRYTLPRSEQARAEEWRTVYDFPQWIKHRSPTRLFDRLTSITRSQVLINVLPSVAWCTSVAGLVTLYMFLLEEKILPPYFPNPEPNIACQTFINSTSVALSLLLVFRTNNGYGRWDESRKMWGLLVNRSRDLIRLVTS